MSNNEIEQIKQFLHSEICERRDYSASKMCEEVLKFIEQMNNNKQETWVNIYNTVNGFIVSKPYPTQTLAITKDEVPEGATYVKTIPSPTEEIIQWDEYGNPIIGGGEMTMRRNNNPGNLNMTVLRDKLDMALDKETADSLNEWLNNKRNMTDEQRAMMQLVSVLDDIQSMMHELVLDERNELIDELTVLYERYNVYVQSRMGGQQ